jgi:hypothetical protein
MKIDHAAQCRFFSAADACRIALQAYYAASRRLQPPPGESWYDESGSPWASCTDFAEAFHGEVEARIGLLALDRLGAFHAVAQSFDPYMLAADADPEKMAPIIAIRETQNAQINAEILGPLMHSLPSGINHADNQSVGEVDNAG